MRMVGIVMVALLLAASGAEAQEDGIGHRVTVESLSVRPTGHVLAGAEDGRVFRFADRDAARHLTAGTEVIVSGCQGDTRDCSLVYSHEGELLWPDDLRVENTWRPGRAALPSPAPRGRREQGGSEEHCREVASVTGNFSWVIFQGCMEMEAEARGRGRR